MKKILGWPAAWVCYFLGDLVSYVPRFDCLAFLYPVYDKLMGASFVVQEWANLKGPWKPVP